MGRTKAQTAYEGPRHCGLCNQRVGGDVVAGLVVNDGVYYAEYKGALLPVLLGPGESFTKRPKDNNCACHSCLAKYMSSLAQVTLPFCPGLLNYRPK